MLFVADEVQTGFGRTGDWFACEHEGVVPDLVATGEGTRRRHADRGRHRTRRDHGPVHGGGLGSTFGGNPVSCAAALASIDVIEREGLVERAQQHRRPHDSNGCHAIQQQTTGVGDVRGRGAMVAMEFVHDDGSPDADRAKRIAAACHAAGRD